MPDNPVTTETPAEPKPLETVAPNLESREAVYAKLYGDQVKPEPAAAEPIAAAPPADDFKAIAANLAAELAAIKASLAAKPTEVPAAVPAEPTKDWFTLLQEGKRTEAEQALIDLVTNSSANKIKQQTLVEGAELARTERAIETFNNQVRAENPDLLDVEDLVSLKAKDYFEQNQSKIKTHKDYIDTYQSAVNSAVTDIRKILQRTRAVAKNEALTTKREVLATSTMTPNDIRSLSRETPAEGPTAPDISPDSYMEMRRQNADLRRNPTAGERRQMVGL